MGDKCYKHIEPKLGRAAEHYWESLPTASIINTFQAMTVKDCTGVDYWLFRAIHGLGDEVKEMRLIRGKQLQTLAQCFRIIDLG